MKIELKKNYLNYIQILRGASVLLIFLFHTDLKIFSKGYLGVDIFFIISGYVITKILEEKFFINYSYDFKSFYIKRILRIVPIYFFIITVFIITFLLIGPLSGIDIIIKKIIFIFTFTSNFYYLNYQKEYFDNIFQDPLNHTWSLAVEMQFYLIFPFLLYFLKKNFNKKLIKKILILIIITGIVLTYYLFCLLKNINLVFYSPIFRSWEFLLGSLVYYLNNNKKLHKNYIINQLRKVSWIFIILIIITIFFSNENYKFLNLILITISTSLFLFLRNNSSNKNLNNYPLLYLGNISYSFYLWHLPILFFFNIYFENKFKFIFAFILTLILSHFSYIYIENKLKNLKININLKILFLAILTITLFLGSINFYYYEFKDFIIKNNYLEKKFSLTKRINYSEIKINNNQIYSYCTPESKIYNVKFDSLRSECLKFTNNKTLIYVEGDSHTAMFMPLILDSKNFENIYFTNNGEYSYKKVNDQLKYFKKIIYVRSINNIDELNYFEKKLTKFNDSINFLIFTPIPNYYNSKTQPVECLIQNKECFFNFEEDYKKRNILEFNKKIKELKSNTINNNIIYFEPYKILCPLKNCLIYNVNNKILTYRDNNHLTIEGSLLLKNNFDIFLKENLKLFD